MPRTILPNLAHCWYDLKGGVKSVWRWLPIIWFDRDWDWAYLAKLVEVKCTRIAKVMETGYHKDGQIAADQLREVARLLSRVQADDYFDEVSGPLISHSAWLDAPDHPGYKEYHSEHYKPDGSKVSDEEFLGWVKAANQTRNAEMRLAMGIIADHLFEWWD